MEKDTTINIEDLKEEVEGKIKDILSKVPDDLKSDIASFIAFSATNWGSTTYFEALGVLESAKINFIEAANAVRMEEEQKLQEIAILGNKKYQA